jgi:UDP-N-acetylglucosamine 2-epimerase (non-hydrolysing)
MRVITILGTRPEIIRLSVIIPKLDELLGRAQDRLEITNDAADVERTEHADRAAHIHRTTLPAHEHVVIHTGQNYTAALSDIFFRELGLRAADYTLADQQVITIGAQLALMFLRVEQILRYHQPHVVVLLGDTNSALCALLAERMGIPVVHLEAGNRCFDLAVPEEKNRRVIDSIASINMPYTPYARENLLREGFPSRRIIRIGNPIHEVITHYAQYIRSSEVLAKLALRPQEYMIVTAHRAENVDHPQHLCAILTGLNRIAQQSKCRLICSIHPRTRARMEQGESMIQMDARVEFYEPFGFFDFVTLEQNACLAITDSGTVQEECCLFHVPTVTIRTTTERPETVDCGSNIVSGLAPERIAEAAQVMLAMEAKWDLPMGYQDLDVSDKVIKFIMGGAWHV